MLKAEVAGSLVEMAVDVGDRVRQGQYLAQIDDALINAQVLEEQARLASAEAALLDAETLLSEARVQEEQAQRDNDRLQSLTNEGEVDQQEADLSQTAIQAAQEQVQSRQANVSAAQQRVEAQKAVLVQLRQQQANSVFTAPITGQVLQQFAETGTTLQVGDRLLQLGNFETLTIALQISELHIGAIELGQSVTVGLDAFPDLAITGRISQISPTADPISRLVPVEVVVPNGDERIGSGLLARVAIAPDVTDTIVIPLSALDIGAAEEPKDETTVLVLNEATSTVDMRTVERGESSDRFVEITAGLSVGDTIVTRSNEPLTDGQTVRLSVLAR